MVRRLVRENQIDIAQIQGSGEGGRITRKDVDALRSLPRAHDRPARVVVATLAWFVAAAQESPGECRPAWDALVDEGGPAAASLLVREMAGGLEARSSLHNVRLPLLAATPSAATTARTLALVERAFTRVHRPFCGGREWGTVLLDGLAGGLEPLAEDLEPLCRWAHRVEQPRLLFGLSALGLREAGPRRPRFLLHRALSLPPGPAYADRRLDCLQAARALARRARDGDLEREAAAALDAVSGGDFLLPILTAIIPGLAPPSRQDPDPEVLAETLDRETSARMQDVWGRRGRPRNRGARRPRGRPKRRRSGGDSRARLLEDVLFDFLRCEPEPETET
ncbi:MAG: E3 binding domain-containing protein [Planctomycetota bacterium]